MEKNEGDFMKKILLSLVIASMLAGCAGARKKGTTDGEGGVTSETTGSGSIESVAPVDFSTAGSDSGTIEGLQTVHFDYDSSTLSETESEKLAGNAKWLSNNVSAKLLIEGHCDQRGSTEYNLSLGERRANAVKSMLIKLGVKTNRLTTTSLGKEKLKAEGDSEAEMAQNRRANFVPTK